MIIDAHTHIESLEDYQNIVNPSYRMPIVGLKAYLEHFEANKVDKCFTFMGMGMRLESRTCEANDGLARLRDKAPERIYPWGSVIPAWPEKKIRGEIRRIGRQLGFFGLKFALITIGYSLSSKGMDIVAEEAIDQGLPVTLHDGSPEYCSAIQTAYYARKYPELTVLSAHGGLRELWPDFITTAKRLPNLLICLSGPTQWGIQRLYDELGPEKLLFGSDGGLGHPAITTAYLRRIDRLQASQEHKAMILGGNALKLIQARRST